VIFIVRNYENPAFWKRGAETLAPALRIASYLPINAPVAPALRAAATALEGAVVTADHFESSTINPQDSPLAPVVPQQVLDIIEGAMVEPPKKKRKVSASQKNFGKALKEAKKKHPRLAKSKSNQARSQLFKAAWRIARKMK
jgi:hypothetical protein